MSHPRTIVTKNRIYELAADARAVPVEVYFAGVALREPLRASGAKVYQAADGPVIAIPRRETKKRRHAEPEPV
jgi:hypothetical protein